MTKKPTAATLDRRRFVQGMGAAAMLSTGVIGCGGEEPEGPLDFGAAGGPLWAEIPEKLDYLRRATRLPSSWSPS